MLVLISFVVNKIRDLLLPVAAHAVFPTMVDLQDAAPVMAAIIALRGSVLPSLPHVRRSSLQRHLLTVILAEHCQISNLNDLRSR